MLVYNEYMSESATDPYMASALSVIIVVCSLTMLAFQKLVVDKRNYMMSSLRPPQETKLRGWKRFFASCADIHCRRTGVPAADRRRVPVLR